LQAIAAETGIPVAGEVFAYPFLWKRQRERGATAGRKPRPICVALAKAVADGSTLLFIVPITTQPPTIERIAVDVPMIEAKRVNLDTAKPCWVMLDELNVDVFEYSYVFDDRTLIGSFSSIFIIQLKEVFWMPTWTGRSDW